MNFYKRHLGDIAKATGHLSQGEMGAYDLLLDWCYSNEKPLPLRLADVHRIGRAATKAERANVDRVLADFFDKTADGYTQKRVLEEMAKANAQAETNRAIAEERERKKKERKEHESCNESFGNRGTNGQPSQTPDTRQEQDQERQGGSAAAEPPLDDPEEITSNRTDPVPYQAIVDAYNQRMTQLAKVRLVNGQRRTAIRRAWQSLPPEHRKPGAFKAIFAECAMDDFLNGSGPYTGEHANWRPDFDHLIKIKTLTKVYEKAMARRERMRQQPESQPHSGASA